MRMDMGGRGYGGVWGTPPGVTGNFRKIFGKILRNFPEFSRKFPENFPINDGGPPATKNDIAV